MSDLDSDRDADLQADLDADFDAAVAAVRTQDTDPGNDVKLRLYALYKQATVGEVTGKRPGFTNPVGRAKFDAWDAVRGMSAAAAKRAYIALAADLPR
ncbi:acyl-CoA-binding protein [Actinopolymorpha sp. B11F2]|uniref:acyl-CoA-binding protein n=1 Tax=Actinopolymorpha sp. B11F2 TaxID=3160862 RepID=UPI0032E3C212